MDFRTLSYFMTVARELNFTRAAEKLNMSQPPLSNQIRHLEEELGTELFVRGKRSLTLTDAGNMLLRRTAQIFDLADQTKQEIAALQNGLSGTIFLGMVEGKAPFLAAHWIAGFREEFPLVKYELWNGSSDDVLDQLRRGLADLAVIAAPFDTEHLDSIMVGREPWVAMIPPDHPLAEAYPREIPLSALAGQPLIVPRRKSRVEAIRKWFADVHVEPQIICEQSNYMDALALTSANVGISIFPQTLRHPGGKVHQRLIVEPARMVEYALVWDKENPPSALAQAFIDYVRDTLAEEGMEENGFTVPEGASTL